MSYSFKDFLDRTINLRFRDAKEYADFQRKCDANNVWWFKCSVANEDVKASDHPWNGPWPKAYGCFRSGDGFEISIGADDESAVNLYDLPDWRVYTPADFYAGRVGVRCETREEYDALMRECEAKGIKWCTGDTATERQFTSLPLQFATNCTVAPPPGIYRRDIREELVDNIPSLSFSTVFPPEPWAEFVAGKCYLRVTKAEWPEFAKRCDKSALRWNSGLKASERRSEFVDRGVALMGRYAPKGNRLDSWLDNGRTDRPIYDFSTLLPAKPALEPKPAPKFKVGDIVRGIIGGDCLIATIDMTRGEVVHASSNVIRVKVLEHKSGLGIGKEFDARPEYFELVPPAPAPEAQPYDGRGKHKVGDKFKLVNDVNTYWGGTWKRGEIVTLIQDDKTKNPFFKHDKTSREHAQYWRDMEPYSFPRIEITTDGRVTTATLYEGEKAAKTATATCWPEDAFDFERGARLALDRLVPGNNLELRMRVDLDTSEFDASIKSVRDALKNLQNRVKVVKAE